MKIVRNMEENQVQSSGLYSYLDEDDALAEYHTTASADEIIRFQLGTKQIFLNSLFVENCGTAVMYVQPLNSTKRVCIPAGQHRNLDDFAITGIKVVGASGQKLRYTGTYYEKQ